jgi:hypothetical protein
MEHAAMVDLKVKICIKLVGDGGRYPVIPYIKCYHDITLQFSKYKWQKKLNKIVGGHKMSLQSIDFLEPNSKYTKRNKKDKSNMNRVKEDKMSK